MIILLIMLLRVTVQVRVAFLMADTGIGFRRKWLGKNENGFSGCSGSICLDHGFVA